MRGHSETERHTPGETEAKSWRERLEGEAGGEPCVCKAG